MAAVRAGLVVAAALASGACSMSFKVFGDDAKAPEPVTTASVPPAQTAPVEAVTSTPLASPATLEQPTTISSSPVMMPGAASIGLTPSDWLYARGALGLALTGAVDGPPVLWTNPETGSRGTFRPASPMEARDGLMCRRFLATRISSAQEDTVEGKACQTPGGQWDVAEVQAPTATATL
jgi:surface antigen